MLLLPFTRIQHIRAGNGSGSAALPVSGYGLYISTSLTIRRSHTVQFSLSVDGHFGLTRLKKVDDPDDVSLSEGRGLFALESEYDAYVKEYVLNDEEVSA